MMNSIIVNDVRNSLQAKRNHVKWVRFNHCNAYIGDEITVTIGDTDYTVTPILSYETVVAFAHNGIMYEVGKYSRTTSKQVTQITNKLGCDRKFYERIWC